MNITAFKEEYEQDKTKYFQQNILKSQQEQSAVSASKRKRTDSPPNQNTTNNNGNQNKKPNNEQNKPDFSKYDDKFNMLVQQIQTMSGNLNKLASKIVKF